MAKTFEQCKDEVAEWLDWTQLIGGKTLIWYFDFDNDCIKSAII